MKATDLGLDFPEKCPVDHKVVARPDTFAEAIPVPLEPWAGNMPWWDYHRLEAVRSSELPIVAERSLAHLRDARDNVDHDDATQAQVKGSMLHAAILEPDTEWRRFVRAPDWLTNRSRKKDKEEWNRLVEEHGADYVLRSQEYDDVVGQAEAIRSVPDYEALLSEGLREFTLVWKDEESGLWCKARTDFMTTLGDRRVILDIKGCPDAREFQFQRKIAEFRYDLRAVHYLAGAAALGVPIDDFAILASEWKRPFACKLWILGHLATVEVERDDVLRRIAEAEATGLWPAYDSDPRVITLPYYKLQEIEARYSHTERW